MISTACADVRYRYGRRWSRAILTQASPIDYLIYGIGIYEGYKLSMRK